MCKDKLFLKLRDTLNNDHSKNPTIRFLQGVMPPKDMDNIAKSEDLDQSAKERSDQDLYFLPRPICSEIQDHYGT